jgi:hypothetical protein
MAGDRQLTAMILSNMSGGKDVAHHDNFIWVLDSNAQLLQLQPTDRHCHFGLAQ